MVMDMGSVTYVDYDRHNNITYNHFDLAEQGEVDADGDSDCMD